MPKKPQTPEQHEQIRAEIVRAAREVYDAEGYAGVTMRAVARKLGYSPAALYRYFDSQIALARSIWQDAVDTMRAEAEAAAAACDDPLDRVEALLRAYASFAWSHPAAFRSTFLQVVIPGPDGEVLLREGSLPETDPREGTAYSLLHRAVKEAIEAGRLAGADPDLVAQTLWSAVHGTVAMTFNFGQFPFADEKTRFEHMLQVLLKGAAAR